MGGQLLDCRWWCGRFRLFKFPIQLLSTDKSGTHKSHGKTVVCQKANTDADCCSDVNWMDWMTLNGLMRNYARRAKWKIAAGKKIEWKWIFDCFRHYWHAGDATGCGVEVDELSAVVMLDWREKWPILQPTIFSQEVNRLEIGSAACPLSNWEKSHQITAPRNPIQSLSRMVIHEPVICHP